MNCQDLQDRLHEYLDETLDADTQAAAREHLRQCGDCRRALLREETVAQSIRRSLDRATAGLSLRPEMQRNILKALKPKPAASNAWVLAWQSFIAMPIRPIGAGAALLSVLLLALGIQFYRPATETPAPQAATQPGPDICVIDVPIQTETHMFRRQDHTVVDAIAPSVSMAHARFPENSKRER
jgi:anti-sigma factor RsiW